MGQRVPGVPLEMTVQRLGLVLRRGYLRRHETAVAFLAGAASVAILVGLHWVAVASVAGAPGPVHQLAYPGILLAAYLFGLPGALLVAVVSTLVSGPFPLLTRPDPASWSFDEAASLRPVMFFLVAIVTGVLFEHLRSALDGWRTTAVRVAQREREGMVALARGAEAKDTDTGDHIRRVQLVSQRLALAAGTGPSEAEALGWAAMLHDVGKLRVPDHVLVKPGPLTPEEVAIVRLHTVWGERILAEGDGYELARRVARWHHENVDGSGYPDGLRGEAIPLAARIVRIADAFDVMTHGRLYQPARDVDWTVEELRRYAGRQFDPALVDVFVDLLDAEPAFASGILASTRSDPGRIMGTAIRE